MNAPKPIFEYHIEVEGQIPPEWQDWFSGMTAFESEEGTRLVGRLPDGAALQGVLTHLASLNLNLISVERKPYKQQE
jgi:hypothetical protein